MVDKIFRCSFCGELKHGSRRLVKTTDNFLVKPYGTNGAYIQVPICLLGSRVEISVQNNRIET